MTSRILTSLVVVFFTMVWHASIQAEALVNICENAAYATGYVYIDQYVVIVDTDSIDQFESEVMWVELQKPEIKILFTPIPYRTGSYVFNKGAVSFYIQGDLKERVGLHQRLSNLAALSAVMVSCRYIL